MRSSLSTPLIAALFLGAVLIATVDGQQQAEPQAPLASGGPVLPVPTTSAQDSMPVTEFWVSGRYRITQSDVLELHFPHVPEFDQRVAVQPDGYMTLKEIGDVFAMGHTVAELESLLAERYSTVLRQPVVRVVLREFEKPHFTVAGEVVRPGRYELRGATTLSQGIVIAGGQSPEARPSKVVLFRQFVGEWLQVKEVDVKKMYDSRDMSEDPLLRHGDTILVPKSVMASLAPYLPKPSLGFILNPFFF
jgi:polysaccharide export outer membrane protein